MRNRRAGSWLVAAVAGSTLLVLLLGAATRLDPVPLGLNAEYFPNTTLAGPPAGTTIDSEPSTNHLYKEWNGAPPDRFSEDWSGDVCPLRAGIYTFAADADTAVTIIVDGRVVAKRDAGHSEEPVRGTIELASGPHPLTIRYVHNGGPVRFNLLWARDNEALAPVPSWALRPKKVRSVARLVARDALDRALALSEWVWVGLLVLAAAALARAGLARIRKPLQQERMWPALAWILAGSVVLNLAGISWGLPGSWVAIELKPQYVLDALAQHFSHGWFDAYPPVHFYTLIAAWSPLLLLSWLDRLTFDSPLVYSALVVISRLVSIVLAAGMVTAAAVCGRRAFGRRAGLIASAILAVTAPFLYYAKTANVDVPYLFWWTLSMVFYLRLLETGRTRDYAIFAAATTLSVCTKDQAYGLYLVAPFVIVDQIWRVNRRAGVRGAFWGALVDRRLITGALVSVALFALTQNLLFNRAGFMAHVRFITGPGSEAYRVYQPTLAGHLELLRQTIRLIEVSMGWPLFLAGVIGLAIAAATPRLRLMTAWLIAPAVSYYFGFINVILYNYDRFVLPMCFVLAVFGGLALDRLLSAGPRARRWGGVAIAGAFAYTLLYAGTVDVLMMRDSRYGVERWAHEHVGRREMIGVSGLKEYLPRLDDFWLEDISTLEELRQEHPSYVVLNADYGRAVPPETAWGQMIAGLEHGSAGYRLVGRYRRDTPWPWLPGGHPDLVGPRDERIVFSTLRNINPTIEIFQREP